VPVILAGSMSLTDIANYQAEHGWFIYWPTWVGLPAFFLFFLAVLAESNRIPFDIPEAESELVAGISTEYTGMKFGLFYLAEYVHTVVASAVCAVLFFGGWDGPFFPGIHWMLLKMFVLFVAIYWIRWSLLRFRADQFMKLCWQWLVPSGLALVALAAVFVTMWGK
jgi:NADH-quinone oxidoreductase subunit H